MAEAIKGLNIKLGLDTTELEASIKSLNSDLKEQQKDLAVINKNLKYDSSNVDLWKQKQEKLHNGLCEKVSACDDTHPFGHSRDCNIHRRHDSGRSQKFMGLGSPGHGITSSCGKKR